MPGFASFSMRDRPACQLHSISRLRSGLDSDDELAAGEVGKVGVAIDSLDDMRVLLDGLPLEDVSTSMTINATAPILLLLYQLVAEERGVSPDSSRGRSKTTSSRSTSPEGPTSIHLGTPCASSPIYSPTAPGVMPEWNTISISGYHIREAGSTAVQEVALTLANALAYVEAAITAGLDVDVFAPRLSFFWNGHNQFFEEVAKYRAARRLWARLMRDRVGATDPKAWAMRFHTQTAGSTLTAQQPYNNVVRTTVQALAAVLGGTQSLHTNAFDEALGLPTEDSATLALRTQQVLAFESAVTDTVDPLAGSYFVEALTDRIEAEAQSVIGAIDTRGGAVAAIEAGYPQGLIEDSAYETAKAIEADQQIVVGVNRFIDDDGVHFAPTPVDPALERDQRARLQAHRDRVDDEKVRSRLAEVRDVAKTSGNLLPPIREALAEGATVGGVSDTLRDVFGVYRPNG